MTPIRVLVVDDDETIRTVLDFNLRELGLEVTLCPDAEKAWSEFRRQPPDLTITDVRMDGMNGLDLLATIREIDPEAIVIVMTAYGSVEQAVEAMKRGAFDYLTKPFDRDSLRLTIRKAIELAVMRRENARLREVIAGDGAHPKIIGGSPAMQDMFSLVARVAPTEATVLIEGETGTGKEMVARSLHYMSARSPGRFVTVNCAAIPRELLESELFGHEKGAFTGADRARAGKFQLAKGGTIFLDEVGEIEPELQKKLLRVLQEKEVDVVGGTDPVPLDVRVVAATNRSLHDLVQENAFREDLFYRLSVIPIRLPPLRQRREDIPLLVKHFLEKHGGSGIQIAEKALEILKLKSWPGNVRELENAVERMVILRKKPGVIDVEDVANWPDPSEDRQEGIEKIEVPDEGIVLDDVEKKYIESALRKTGWNQSAAARLLGITRQTLLYRIQKYSIERE